MNGLVIGKSGQLARALAELDTPHDLMFLDRAALDLSLKSDQITAKLDVLDVPDFVIVAAAYTAVDKAEDDKETAAQVNCGAVIAIGDYCSKHAIPVVHISTDYVFPGNANEPYTPDMATGPTNVYGQTKRDGELGLMASGAQASILRTSWVYDGTGKNFMTTMLRLGKDRDALSVVGDQIGRPTFAGHLAKASLVAAEKMLADKTLGGIHHVSNSGNAISWADFAGAIFTLFENDLGKTVKVTPIPSSEYPTPATRPAYSVMDVTSYEKSFGYELPSWRDGLDAAAAAFRSAANV